MTLKTGFGMRMTGSTKFIELKISPTFYRTACHMTIRTFWILLITISGVIRWKCFSAKIGLMTYVTRGMYDRLINAIGISFISHFIFSVLVKYIKVPIWILSLIFLTRHTWIIGRRFKLI